MSVQNLTGLEESFAEGSERTLLTGSERMAAVEAVLFAAGDPISPDILAEIGDMNREQIDETLDQLRRKYQRDPQCGLMLRTVEGKVLLSTKVEWSETVARLFRPQHRPALSQAAYETLAIVAYNQPVTRAQVEDVRGVNSDSIISRLIERGLIRETGTLDLPGRPAVFAVTEQFLLDFGLDSVADLPPTELLTYDSLRQFDPALSRLDPETFAEPETFADPETFAEPETPVEPKAPAEPETPAEPGA